MARLSWERGSDGDRKTVKDRQRKKIRIIRRERLKTAKTVFKEWCECVFNDVTV